MFGAPMTNPSPRQPVTSLATTVLWVITWPQCTVVGVVAGVGGVGGGLASAA
jgi:hypothetical protein